MFIRGFILSIAICCELFFFPRIISFQYTYRTFLLHWVVIVGASHEATVSQPNCVQDGESATSDNTTFAPETTLTTNAECNSFDAEIMGEINSTVTLRCDTEDKGFAVCEIVNGLIETNRISRNFELQKIQYFHSRWNGWMSMNLDITSNRLLKTIERYPHFLFMR